MAKSNESLTARIRSLLSGNAAQDKVANFYWTALPEMWAYSANRIGEVADTIVEIDRAMKAGFNWELGPFAMWDAAGVVETVAKMREAGLAIPAAVEKLLAAGGTSWYRAEGTEFFDVASGAYRPVDLNPELASVASYKRANGVYANNAGISLMDLGDGIGCFEFHSKMNSLGQDIVGFLKKQLQPGSDAVKNFDGFIITNDATNFSVGANLMQLLMGIQDEEWDEIDLMVREFQTMTQAIKFCPRPVVSAPFGMCLGGGAEIACTRLRGNRMLSCIWDWWRRAWVCCRRAVVARRWCCGRWTLRTRCNPGGGAESVEVHEAMRSVFETIAMAKVSTSAFEAKALRILRRER